MLTFILKFVIIVSIKRKIARLIMNSVDRTSSNALFPTTNIQDALIEPVNTGTVAEERTSSNALPPTTNTYDAQIEQVNTGTVADDLTGWKKILYKTALLAPKLLLSGVGWTVGFMLGGNVGAAFGDMLGTFVGCAISFGIEMLIRKYVLNDPSLEGKMMETLKTRFGQALILSAGAFVGGLLFNPALKWTGAISSPILHSLAAGAITATGFMVGMQTSRAVYTVGTKALGTEANEALELSIKNFKSDARVSAFIVFPAQTAFYWTAVPIFGVTVFMGTKLALLSSAGTVAGGGLVGQAISEGARMIDLKKREPSERSPEDYQGILTYLFTDPSLTLKKVTVEDTKKAA
jgi:hypothetical protein